MPPPKRPFTTSSLTSTLKSTIASQPLLSNLTSIDKLSSQASSLAQRTPFFGANQQPTQHQDNVTGPSGSAAASTSTNMMRGNQSGPQQQQHLAAGGAHHQQQQPPSRQVPATTPTVDMSHLTEEERLMIQSVMAKAEMADMGMPVDTSAPSSTNLPSNASQALVQQQQQARQQQQQAHQMSHQPQQQQRPFNQQQQPNQQQSTMRLEGGDQQGFVAQQQPQMNMMRSNGNNPPSTDMRNQQQNMNQANSFNQQQFQQHSMQNQPFPDQRAATSQAVSQANANVHSSLPSLEQQTQALVNQINNQFNLNQNQPQQTDPIQMNQQQGSLGQPGSFNIPQANAQQQQQQLQNQLPQQSLLDQQMRMQQILNPNNFDQPANTANNQGQGIPQNVAQQQFQQMGNPLMSQQFPSSDQRSIQQQQLQQQQQQIQQQQIQQQQQLQLNQLVNEREPRLPGQPVNQRTQLELESASIEPMMAAQLIDPLQQQMMANTYLVNQPPSVPQRANIQQAPISVLDRQMNPISSASGSNFIQAPQVGVTAVIEPTGQRMSSSKFPTSPLDNHHQQFNPTNEFGQRQFPYNSEIRFGPQQQIAYQEQHQNDHALSDQEYTGHSNARGHGSHAADARHGVRRYDSVDANEGRARAKFVDIREPLDSREKSLQAYDLAQRSDLDRHHHAKRQLPRPHQQHDHQHSGSPSEQSHERHRSREKPPGNKRQAPQREQESPGYLSESEEENVAENKRRDTSEGDASASVRKSNAVDKNEEAIRVLSELKLTEQANQVMEQQQLLIKQSQELIKLQLEQQALSQELKKTIKQAASPNDNQGETKAETASQQQNQSGSGEGQENQSSSRSQTKQDAEAGTRSNESRPMRENEDERRSTFIHNDSEPDSPRVTLKTSEGTRFMSQNGGQREPSERDKIGRRTAQQHLQHQNSTNSSSQTGPTLRYNRDLLQSPTDTTDSDVEPLSRSQAREDSRNRQQKFTNQQVSKPKTGVARRREPTGLPPSPLPVAAAIQLHQMQQQHFRQQINSSSGRAGGSSNRANFLRSRSVTSSPSYHLEHANNSGYLTDNQRNRASSPDTMSEFGGQQRRRKRLPEPPSNAVPITPSMVRKMIQAQKSGSVASGKLLTSVNAHSTLLTNTHSTRNLAFERSPNNPDNTSSNFTKTLGTSNNTSHPYGSNIPSSIAQTSATISVGQNPANPQRGPLNSGASDLNKFLSSTYGNSILRNNISDVKETPELDKLISNLDEYYGLDTNNRRQQQSQNRALLRQSSDVHLTTDTYNPSLLSGALTSISPTRGLSSNSKYSYNPSSSNYPTAKPLYPANSSYIMRRSSEGESNLARLTARRPYRQVNLDDGYRNYGRNFTSNSYLEGRNLASSSYLNPASPIRQSRGYTSQIPTTSGRYNRDYLSTGYNDHYLSSSANNTGTFDRASQYYRPMSNQYLNSSRLHSNPTGSLDLENLDYLAPASSELLNSQLAPLSDSLGSASSKYQHHFSNTNPSIDLIRDKYRYSGTNDIGSRYKPTSDSFNPRYQTSGLGGSAHHNPRPRSPYDPTSSRGDIRSTQYPMEPMIDSLAYTTDPMGHDPSTLSNTRTEFLPHVSYADTLSRTRANPSGFAPLTKSDIINNGPKFNSIGYRFRTENQNKYVAQARNPNQCLQSRYPHPYKRILLSKNPKDRIGNGIGVRITGGQPMPNLYDKVNRSVVTSGAFVTEVFQNSNVHFMGEMQEGDQIIEWNGVNLCNRSNEEVQQILFSQFSDDEVEIVYLPQDKFHSAYDESSSHTFNDGHLHGMIETAPDAFDTFADMNKSGRQSSVTPIVARSRYGDEAPKGSIRRKLSLSHIAHMWSK